mgnify:CR=1 FL=1
MVQQPLNANQISEDKPVNIREMDFAFLTGGDPHVEPHDQLNSMMQNLSKEEQQELVELTPHVERFFILTYKAETGEYPPEPNTGNVSREQYNAMLSNNTGDQLAMMTDSQQNNSSNLIPKSRFDKSPSSIPNNTLQMEQPVETMQLGGQVSQKQTQEIPAGPVGEVQVAGKDTSGVADDVQTQSDGFILSKGAVIANGKMYIYDLIDEAIQRLKEKGVELDPSQVPESAEDILVSNGEIIIPDIIAQEIGYKRLEKMNKRGEQITEELIAEKEQGQQQVIQPPTQREFAPPEPQSFNEGGMTGQEQYVQDMQETVNVLDEQAADTDPNIEEIHLDQLPAESPAENIYQYPREKVKQAISQHEWRNQKPKYAFVALSGNIRSSAYGPGQMIQSSLKDMSDNGVFGDGELKEYADKIIAAQTLFLNYWVNNMGMRATNIASGKKALNTLGISKDQFKKYVNEGYFTPSNRKNAKDEGIPREILGKNANRNYDFLWDAFIDNKLDRSDVTGINTFLTSYYGGSKQDTGEYVRKVRQILDN